MCSSWFGSLLALTRTILRSDIGGVYGQTIFPFKSMALLLKVDILSQIVMAFARRIEEMQCETKGSAPATQRRNRCLCV